MRDDSVVESIYWTCRRAKFVSKSHVVQWTTAYNSTSRGYDNHYCYLKMFLALHSLYKFHLKIYTKSKNRNKGKALISVELMKMLIKNASEKFLFCCYLFVVTCTSLKRNQHSTSMCLILLCFFIYECGLT